MEETALLLPLLDGQCKPSEGGAAAVVRTFVGQHVPLYFSYQELVVLVNFG